MTRASVTAGSRVTDLVYAVTALVAAVLAVVNAQFNPAVVVAMLIALVPWALLVFGIELPLLAFAALAIIPVIPVIALSEIGAALFLSLAAASRLASRTDDWWLIGSVTAVIMVVPFVPFLFGVEWDVGAIYFAFGGAFAVLIGVLLRRATRLADELRAAEGELADAAAREERHRIARDVHDLVAHSLTVVVLHVGGARRVIRSNPDAAEAALIEAERVSRESLDAIRGAVGMLRDDDESEWASLDLERLVTTYRSAGLPVELRIVGTPEPLSLPIRLTLYRVVQEALANAARHSAPGASAAVQIAIDDHAVIARVSNPFTRAGATDAATDLAPDGYGLVGLREQAASLGGELSGGPEGGSWVVECRLPVGGAA
ncbi:sensor histidine kinase [Agromyces humi]|uniref:sensor histidine kinase n=1 Tax=Agromyces humi TaxID=1766800 RepID=UPI0013590CAF|nr:histidine kinase [Agromyces humi]